MPLTFEQNSLELKKKTNMELIMGKNTPSVANNPHMLQDLNQS